MEPVRLLPRVPTCSARPTGRFVLAMLTAVVCAAGAVVDDAVKTELKRHQGTWVATSSTFDGQKAADDVVRSIKRIATDDHVVWERSMASASPEPRLWSMQPGSQRQST